MTAVGQMTTVGQKFSIFLVIDFVPRQLYDESTQLVHPAKTKAGF